MKSELKVSAPSLKVTLTIGLFLTILLTFLAVTFRFEFSLILLSVAGSIAGIGVIVIAGRIIAIIHDRELGKLAIELKRQELRLKTYEADKAHLQAYVLSLPKTQRIVTLPDSPIKVIEALPEESKPALLATGATDDPLPNLLEAIEGESCVAFWGGRNSGKTTCALWWLSTRNGQNVVYDPKPRGLNAWPNARVINDIDWIEQAVNGVYTELFKRQKGELLHELTITLFIDELYALTHVHKLDIMTKVFGVITLGREYNVHAGFTTSSKGVKALGIEGMSGLAEALTFVHTSIVGGQHKVMVDQGEGEFEVKPLGKYKAQAIPHNWPDLQPLTIALTEDDQIAEMNREGNSNYAISQAIWGSRNDKLYKRIDEIRATL